MRRRSDFLERVYDEGSRNRDARLKKSLNERGLRAESFKASLLFEPWEIKNQSGAPFKVFTPFWRACRAHASPGDPLPPAEGIARTEGPGPASDALDDWRLLPTNPDWAGGLRTAWSPGEKGAKDRLSHFLDEALEDYRHARDLPAVEGTSRLSPHLAFGEISPRQVWRGGDQPRRVGGRRKIPLRSGLARVRLQPPVP